MKEPIELGKSYGLANLVRFAERVVTEEGNIYYRFPCWFQELPGDFEFILHRDLPDDLSQFITKAGLGGDNPQIKEPN